MKGRYLRVRTTMAARGVLPIVLLMGFVLYGANCPEASARSSTVAASRMAPAFSRADLTGHRVNLADYRGKVVLLNFWATWCGPCIVEIPQFVGWQQEYGGRGFEVIGVSMDDDAKPVRTAYQKYKLNYPVVMGDERIGGLYGGVLGLPQTFLIDRSGKIRFSHQGETNLEQVKKEIQLLLSQKR